MFGTLTYVVFIATLAATPCENLKAVSLSNTTIMTSEFVSESRLQPGERGGPGRGARGAAPTQPPVARGQAQGEARGGRGRGGGGGEAGTRGRGRGAGGSDIVPAHCRVVAVLRPSNDSEINMELWLPPAGVWNGKFQVVGNGAWGGSIQGLDSTMPEALRLGYATAGHDTGHRGGGGFALGHPEKVIDFAYRAVHEVTAKSKTLIKAFYDQGPRLSYFNGCSGGGRQALMSAQRYPEDFDGILAGAPANPHISLHAGDMARVADMFKDAEGFISQEKKENVLGRAVMNACDALDGLKDNLISNPMACKFDPSVLLCKAGDRPDCLTAKQVETAKRNYAPTRTSNGTLVFPGMSFGVEARPSHMTGGTGPGALQLDTFRYIAHQDRNWDWRNFDIDTDPELARKNAGFIDAIDPDLTRFKEHGGKLLMYHGWADPAIAPESSVNYYSSVIAKMGTGQDSWLRLFMVPNMGHCGRGEGPTDADWLDALDNWRDRGKPLQSVLGSGVNSSGRSMTRPLCPYPQLAVYQGRGDVNNAANFVCK
jgi:feruloyl esterase